MSLTVRLFTVLFTGMCRVDGGFHDFDDGVNGIRPPVVSLAFDAFRMGGPRHIPRIVEGHRLDRGQCFASPEPH